MSSGGWIMMVASVGGATAFFAWCLYRVLTTPDATKHLHSQADITPPDVKK